MLNIEMIKKQAYCASRWQQVFMKSIIYSIYSSKQFVKNNTFCVLFGYRHWLAICPSDQCRPSRLSLGGQSFELPLRNHGGLGGTLSQSLCGRKQNEVKDMRSGLLRAAPTRERRVAPQFMVSRSFRCPTVMLDVTVSNKPVTPE